MVLDGPVAPTPKGVDGCGLGWSALGFDAGPEVVEGEAVVERRPIDDLAVAQLQGKVDELIGEGKIRPPATTQIQQAVAQLGQAVQQPG